MTSSSKEETGKSRQANKAGSGKCAQKEDGSTQPKIQRWDRCNPLKSEGEGERVLPAGKKAYWRHHTTEKWSTWLTHGCTWRPPPARSTLMQKRATFPSCTRMARLAATSCARAVANTLHSESVRSNLPRFLTKVMVALQPWTHTSGTPTGSALMARSCDGRLGVACAPRATPMKAAFLAAVDVFLVETSAESRSFTAVRVRAPWKSTATPA